MSSLIRTAVALLSVALHSGCANTAYVSTVQPLADAADVPYKKILVLAVFDSFETRSLAERAMVNDIKKTDTDAVAATAEMLTTTPLNAETLRNMIAKTGADAILVTQVLQLSDSTSKVKNRSPEASWKVRPTYYFNVWEVRLNEYMEPPFLETEAKILLLTELFETSSQELVWVAESKAKIVKDMSRPGYYPVVSSAAEKIARQMQDDGIMSP